MVGKAIISFVLSSIFSLAKHMSYWVDHAFKIFIVFLTVLFAIIYITSIINILLCYRIYNLRYILYILKFYNLKNEKGEKMDISEVLGFNVKYSRHKKHLTQEQLAERFPFKLPYISIIERGFMNLTKKASRIFLVPNVLYIH